MYSQLIVVHTLNLIKESLEIIRQRFGSASSVDDFLLIPTLYTMILQMLEDAKQ
jgi:hypothetical protein